ncbi:MAG: 50S ribosomal protein L11 methyltransferase [Nitriliruptor sp.]
MPPADPPRPTRHRYTVPVAREDLEVVAATLWAAGATGVWEQPGQLVAWFPTDDVADLPPGGEFRVEPDRDWQAEWKATITPVRAGRFCVVPTWLADDHRATDDEVTLVLDPGRAFGSGHHATTAQCLALLDELTTDGDRVPGDLSGLRVADIGCGSGVLAIAAATRGAHAVGCDVDPEAIAVTAENAGRNGVEVPATVGSVAAATELLGGLADVVLANLVTDTIAELAAELIGALAPGGTLIASGIATDRAAVATDPLERAGVRLDEVRELDGWTALRGVRTAGAA